LVLPLGFSFYRLWRHTYDVTGFCARASGQTVFTLFTDKPNAVEFQNFVGTLRKRIAELRDVAPSTDSTAEQLQSFARLREQGILTDEEFAKIKERLLDTVGRESRRLGFHSGDRT
jgi:hypothetical protein